MGMTERVEVSKQAFKTIFLQFKIILPSLMPMLKESFFFFYNQISIFDVNEML
jgi:hypothetical protein